MQAIEIFRPGTFMSMEGRSATFSASDLANTAAAYDPELHEAPIVIGHPEGDAPAYGWIKGLSFADDSMTAAPDQVDPEFAELVRAGRYKKISASFYEPNHPNNPTPGVRYLRHVAFLGAQPPALKGLKQVSFAEEDASEVVTIEFSEGQRTDAGEDSSGLAGLILAGVARMVGSASFSENHPERSMKTKPAGSGSEDADLKSEREKLDADQASFSERETAFNKRVAEARKKEDGALLDQLVEDGKLAPGLKDGVASFMASLADDDQVVSFSEGGETRKDTPRAFFRGLLAQAKPVISFGETAGDDKSKRDGAADEPTAAQIGAKTGELVEEARKAGRTLSYAEAGVQAKKLLTEGGK